MSDANIIKLLIPLLILLFVLLLPHPLSGYALPVDATLECCSSPYRLQSHLQTVLEQNG